jgi:sugar lactone lactonase YvrE
MKRINFFVLVLLFLASTAVAEVEWQINRNFKLPAAPVDITTSSDGQKIFVLLKGGEVHIYDTNGQQLERLRFGTEADKIIVTPDGERLLLSDSKTKQVKLVSLDYIKSIDISGSPFKGPKDAKVVVAVYSDFQ